jgi:hypothetical protein
MKILYISSNQRTEQFPWLVDYQNDCLLYGLKELFGDDVVDCNKRYNLYSDYSDADMASEYGKGFTICRLLDSDKTDRDDIRKKIKNKYFDYVVYGSISRCQDYLDLVLETYERNKIAFIDGEDSPKFSNFLEKEVMYFKRELVWEQNMEAERYFQFVAPIGFAFPGKKIFTSAPKDRKLAYIDPSNPKTYIYNDESSYYSDYRHSKFAMTKPKAGWDAMRHYEIMGNGCVPIFPGLEHCPRFTMMKFPKALLIKVLFFYANDPKWLDANYEELKSDLMDHFVKFNTTKAMAESFMKDIKGFQPR